MPGRDRTGPLGEGPMTGGGLGFCGRGLALRKGFGRRLGRFGRGYGRGFGRVYEYPEGSAALTKEEEKKILKEEKAEIEQELKRINERLNETDEQ